jgi:hypothetical protein
VAIGAMAASPILFPDLVLTLHAESCCAAATHSVESAGYLAFNVSINSSAFLSLTASLMLFLSGLG